MNPLEALIYQLTQQAGPRGATFAGRYIPQDQENLPSLESILSRLPTESPDAEGFANLAPLIGAAGITKQVMKIPGGSASVKGPIQGVLGYHVIDRQTGEIIGKYGPNRRTMARNLADRLDYEYGASRYHVKPLYEGK